VRHSTAQGYTTVWVAVNRGCWVAGFGSQPFEREAMRGSEQAPAAAA
jgi:hypothetical protein